MDIITYFLEKNKRREVQKMRMFSPQKNLGLPQKTEI